MYDILIKNGQIIDGSGAPAFYGDIAVTGDTIENIGMGLHGKRELDCTGLTATPGFVDIHLHGGGGAEFIDGTLDSFETVAKTHCLHGTTSICPGGILIRMYYTTNPTKKTIPFSIFFAFLQQIIVVKAIFTFTFAVKCAIMIKLNGGL